MIHVCDPEDAMCSRVVSLSRTMCARFLLDAAGAGGLMVVWEDSLSSRAFCDPSSHVIKYYSYNNVLYPSDCAHCLCYRYRHKGELTFLTHYLKSVCENLFLFSLLYVMLWSKSLESKVCSVKMKASVYFCPGGGVVGRNQQSRAHSRAGRRRNSCYCTAAHLPPPQSKDSCTGE